MKAKKGVSPLLATVLLIAFTLTIALLVIFWGQGLIRDYIAKQAASSQADLLCETDVEIDITAIECSASQIRVTIENKRNIYISSFASRIIGKNEAVTVSAENRPIDAFGTIQLTFVYNNLEIDEPDTILVIPNIIKNNVQASCETKAIEARVPNCGIQP